MIATSGEIWIPTSRVVKWQANRFYTRLELDGNDGVKKGIFKQ
jgi:hypothetical protein